MSTPLLTPADLAEVLKLPEAKVMELRRKHDWPHVRLGRRFRFTEAQVEQIVAAQTPKTAGAKKSASGLTPGSARKARG